MPERLSWDQVLAWRLERHHLARPVPRKRALDVVRDLCGLHAQVMSSAELTLWARVDGLAREEVGELLWEHRRLVKTWAMRGTLHLLPADELGLWLGGFATYDHYLKPAWFKAFDISREELFELIELVGKALSGAPLTREELAEEVGRLGRAEHLDEKLRQSWGGYLKPAAFHGRLCFGPDRGRNVTFTRPDLWVDGLSIGEPDEALPEITRRWLRAYGPGTREHMARWFGLQSPARAGRMLDALGDEVIEVDVDGRALRMLAEDLASVAAAATTRSARLVPGFDQWVVNAPRGEPAVLDPAHKARVYRQAGWISPALLVNGRIEGVWSWELKGKRLRVEVEPFAPAPKRVRTAIERDAEKLAAFLGGELSLGWA